mmetsp:Transcript_27803/g.69090  ORF Transcript_27803/g.69090 Transcript_27803/m.69090 type:complete len:105 (+) Transcript_27803:663-977(+)
MYGVLDQAVRLLGKGTCSGHSFRLVEVQQVNQSSDRGREAIWSFAREGHRSLQWQVGQRSRSAGLEPPIERDVHVANEFDKESLVELGVIPISRGLSRLLAPTG